MSHDGAALYPPMRQALCDYLLAWADNELVLGHRDSEWTGFAPIIEEDVAFSSIAQDELGHASLLYGLAAELLGDDPDHLALGRPAAAYRHSALVERPNGDWAFTIARHHLYDLADSCRLEALARSAYAPLAAVARKMGREEQYHLMHGAAWWERLRDGTPESRERLLVAARAVVSLLSGVFDPTAGDELLVASGFTPEPGALRSAWCAGVRETLASLDPALPALLDTLGAPTDSKPRPVTPAFAALHADMTMVSAAGIGEKW